MTSTLLAGVCLLALACNKTEEKKETPAPPPSESTAAAPPSATAPPTPATASAAAEGKTVELKVTAQATTMAFDPTTLTVPAGSTVHLVLENKKPGALAHNWALVNPGTEAKVAADGLAKGEAANYIAPGADLLANTELVKPGTTGEVTFKAPAAGKYPYICTFPGHYMMMKGTLTVTP
ncbi:MAG TPA: plastocyanin/azurin family copper-binding protein [Polyangiaceae bacterium]|nr:plastocyanin/azurin family copper-binding protein [Polyangiaceae bacterium]